MLAHARADSASLATRRDLWAPETLGLPHRRPDDDRGAGLWEQASDAALPSKRQ